MRVGWNCLKYLKKGWNRKEGRQNKNLKKGVCKLGQGVGALKWGKLEPPYKLWSGVDEIVHPYSSTYGQSIMIYCYMMGLDANFTIRQIASSGSSYANCHYNIYQVTFST